jgi:hypothetical protein
MDFVPQLNCSAANLTFSYDTRAGVVAVDAVFSPLQSAGSAQADGSSQFLPDQLS